MRAGTITFIGACCLSLLAGAMRAQEVTYPNLLRNSSFEEGLAAWSAAVSDPSAASVQVVGGGSRWGSKFVRLRADEGGEARLYSRDIPVYGGKDYTVSAYARAGNARAVRMGFWCLDEQGDTIDERVGAELPLLVPFQDQPNWAHVYRKIRIPTAAVRLRVHMILTGPGEVDFDAVKVERFEASHKIFAEFSTYSDGFRADGTPQPTQYKNLTTNSGFEQGPLAWQHRCKRGSYEVSHPSEGLAGSRCLRLSGIAEGTVCSYYPIPIACKGNTTYTISLYVKSRAARRLRCLVRFWGEGLRGIKFDRQIALPETTEPFKRFSLTVDSPRQARFIGMEISCSGGTVWVDSVQIEEGPAPTPYEVGPPCVIPQHYQASRQEGLEYTKALVREGRCQDLRRQAERLILYGAHHPNLAAAGASFRKGVEALDSVGNLLQRDRLVPDFVRLDYKRISSLSAESAGAFQDVFTQLGHPQPSVEPWQPPLLGNMHGKALADQFIIIPHSHRRGFYYGRIDPGIYKAFGFRACTPPYPPYMSGGQLRTEFWDKFIDMFADAGVMTSGDIGWHNIDRDELERKYGDRIYLRGEAGPKSEGVMGGILNIFNDDVMAEVRRYFSAAAEYYKANPNVINLVEIMNEAGIKAGFSDGAVKAFRQWLRQRYGSIGELNEVWGSSYGAFSDVQPPRNGSTFVPEVISSTRRVAAGPYYDFRQFRCVALVKHMSMLVDLLHEKFPDLAVSAQFTPGNGWVRADWSLNWLMMMDVPDWDLFGQHDWFHRLSRVSWYDAGLLFASLERYTRKPVWLDEVTMLAFEGRPLRPEIQLRAAVTRNMWRNIAWGKRGISFFGVDCSEHHTSVGGTGDGTHNAIINQESDHKIPYYRTGGIPTVERKVNLVKDVLFKTYLANQGVAILLPTTSGMIEPGGWNKGPNYDIVRFLNAPLFEHGLVPIVVPEECIIDGREDLTRLKVIIAPKASFVPDALQEKLIPWLRAGGVLISSMPFGLFDPWGRPTGTLLAEAFGDHVYRLTGPDNWAAPTLKGAPHFVGRIGKGRVLLSLEPFMMTEDASNVILKVFSETLGPSFAHTTVPNTEIITREDDAGNRLVWVVNLSRQHRADGKLRLRGRYDNVFELTADCLPTVPVSVEGRFTYVPLLIDPGQAVCFYLGRVRVELAVNRRHNGNKDRPKAPAPSSSGPAIWQTEHISEQIKRLQEQGASDAPAVQAARRQMALSLAKASLRRKNLDFAERFLNLARNPADTPALDGAYVAERTNARIVIDGRLGDWPATLKAPLPARGNFRSPKATRGDCYPQWMATWNSEMLYIAVEVEDDQVCPRDNPAQYVQGDSVELFVDLLGDSLPAVSGPGYGPDDIYIVVTARGRTYVRTFHPILKPSDVRATAIATSRGYNIEIAIPWQRLATTPAAGMIIRFDVAVNDADRDLEAGRQEDLFRAKEYEAVKQRHLVWRGRGDNEHDLTALGILQLASMNTLEKPQ